ncbi:hypothetical protein ACO0LM_15870 [Undibacterium sp. Di26W]|uniref:hypothetical protein n=1 Tax=Undibacterium sp. Di26W TaxID=3413035 RepID=UPI003BF2F3ED
MIAALFSVVRHEVAHYDYDNTGHLWRSNSGGVTRVMQYDVQGHQTVTLSSAGISTASLNLGNGDPLASISSAAQANYLSGLRRSTTQYDAQGRAITLTLPTRDGQTPVIQQSFDRWGNLTSRSDLNGFNGKTTYQYNASNQLIRQSSPDAAGQQSANSAVTAFYYDRAGRQIATRDANGNVNRQRYDANGQLVQETHADSGIVSHAYDAFGNQITLTDANGNHIHYQYDHMGRLVETSSDPVGLYGFSTGYVTGSTQSLVSRITYDQAGRVTVRSNANAETMHYTYDLRGNVVFSQKPLGQFEQYAYDTQGHQIAYRDANGNISTWQFNAQGQLQSHKDIGGATYSYRYDSAGQLLQQTNSRGQNLNYHYNEAGQVTQIRDLATDKTTLYSYNLAGQHTREQTIQADISLQNTRLTYNAQGQISLIEALDDGYLTALGYDKAGNLSHESDVQQTQAAGTTSRQVSISGSMHTVSHETVASTSFVHNNNYAYDSMQRQILVEGANNNNAADANNVNSTQGHLLTYDKNGNVTSDTSWGKELVGQIQTDANGWPTTVYVVREGLITRYFTYDAANRVTSIAVASYDPQGNRLQRELASVVDQRMYDGAGRLLQQGVYNGTMDQRYLEALKDSQLAAYAETTTQDAHYYDANGLIRKDTRNNVLGQTVQQTDYTNYDTAGHLRGYSSDDNVGNHVDVTLEQTLGEGYLQSQVQSTYTNADWSSLNSAETQQSSYDVNGQLMQVNITNSSNGTDTHSVKHQVTDARGQVVLSEQAGIATSNLIVNRQVFNSWTGANHNNFVANSGNGTGKTDTWATPAPAPTTAALFATRAMFSAMALSDGEAGAAAVFMDTTDSVDSDVSMETQAEDNVSFAPMMMSEAMDASAESSANMPPEIPSIAPPTDMLTLLAELGINTGRLAGATFQLQQLMAADPATPAEVINAWQVYVAGMQSLVNGLRAQVAIWQGGGTTPTDPTNPTTPTDPGNPTTPTLPQPPALPAPVTSNDLGTLQTELNMRTYNLTLATTQLQQLTASNPTAAATLVAWQAYIDGLQAQMASINTQITALQPVNPPVTPPAPAGTLAAATAASASLKTTVTTTNTANATNANVTGTVNSNQNTLGLGNVTTAQARTSALTSTDTGSLQAESGTGTTTQTLDPSGKTPQQLAKEAYDAEMKDRNRGHNDYLGTGTNVRRGYDGSGVGGGVGDGFSGAGGNGGGSSLNDEFGFGLSPTVIEDNNNGAMSFSDYVDYFTALLSGSQPDTSDFATNNATTAVVVGSSISTTTVANVNDLINPNDIQVAAGTPNPTTTNWGLTPSEQGYPNLNNGTRLLVSGNDPTGGGQNSGTNTGTTTAGTSNDYISWTHTSTRIEGTTISVVSAITSGVDDFVNGLINYDSSLGVMATFGQTYSTVAGMNIRQTINNAGTSIANFVNGAIGGADFNHAIASYNNDNYLYAALYGMRSLGNAGLTLLSFGTYGVAREGVVQTAESFAANRATYVGSGTRNTYANSYINANYTTTTGQNIATGLPNTTGTITSVEGQGAYSAGANSAGNLSSVWGLTPTARGTAIEANLAQTEYADWFNAGQLNNGKFPLIDFQKGNTLVSLKSVDTTGTSWMGRMQNEIDNLGTNGATVNGQLANMVLDIRVQPGGSAAAQPLVNYGAARGVTVIIKEYP